MDSPTGSGFDLTCLSCGSACRAVDRFCSQCGRPDPGGRDDLLLSSPTVVAGDVRGTDAFPTFVAPRQDMDEPALTDAARARRSRDAAALQQMLVPGSVFGRRYRIQQFLGAGAMGYVCSAVDQSIDEVVALKVLSIPIQHDPEAFERFKTELKLARKIRHRNVVQSFDLGFAEGYPFISMEYINADNLQVHLRRRKTIDEPEALMIVRQVLRGLRAAHDLGIVHRDIKPENILLNKDRMAFITDFGIATSADPSREKELAGTPDYMAPEQLRADPVSAASDLYSCGVMLYHMLTGKLPYRATTMSEIKHAHRHLEPEPIPESAPVSAETRALLEWMLQKKIADRPQDAAPLLKRIDALLASKAMSHSGSRRMVVLVVEHDPDVLAMIHRTVEAEGFRVLTATNAREGVNLAFQQTPAMIFLDARIRGGFDLPLQAENQGAAAQGLEFVRIVRLDEKLRSVPIVLMTEDTLGYLDTTFQEAGIADVLVKPLHEKAVLDALRTTDTAATQVKELP